MKSKKPWYEKGWFLTLCFLSLILSPVAIFIIWKFKKWNNFWKILLSVIGGISFLFIVLGICLSSNNSEQTTLTSAVSDGLKENSESSDKENEADQISQENQENDENAPENVLESETPDNKDAESSESLQNSEQSSQTSTTSSNYSKKPNAELSKSRTVYITPSGKKYHYANPCGKGKYSPISLDEAKKRGFEPCGKCVLH